MNLSSYLIEELLPLPFCPGCGHAPILKHLDQALVAQQLDPHQVVMVTDIGCAGLSDQYFRTNAFHGLHGRSITYASGIKLANPQLKPIVIIGDGGCGIGGHHLINAARRNIGISVLVLNNFNYGMTGGEHSISSPLGALTSSTPYGNLEKPLDLCALAATSGASFVARTTSFNKDLASLITQAMQTDGFALIDIWELCTSYYAPKNRLGGKDLLQMMASLGFAEGILHQEQRPEMSAVIHSFRPPPRSSHPQQPLEVRFEHQITRPKQILAAGAAGSHIAAAAASFCQAAVSAGLWASLRQDYPITVKSGHSLASMTLSPEETLFSERAVPDTLLITFNEGLVKTRSLLPSMGPEATVYLSSALPAVETRARKVVLDFAASGMKRDQWALMGLARMLEESGDFPLEALQAAVAGGAFGEENLAALAAARTLRSAS